MAETLDQLCARLGCHQVNPRYPDRCLTCGMLLAGGSWSMPPLTLCFIVNGEELEVTAPEHTQLENMMRVVLLATGNTGRPLEDWRARDDDGHALFPASPINAFFRGCTGRVWLALAHACGHAGCDFRTNDPGELAVHDVTAHDFLEVAAVELPPLSVPGTLPPLEQFERGLAQLRCERSGGHVPSLRIPGTCCSCLASLEVLRG